MAIKQQSNKMITKHLNILSGWAKKNNVKVETVKNGFLINKYTIIRPEFYIDGYFYVDIIDEIDDDYIEYCKDFSNSFGPIILIPEDDINLFVSKSLDEILKTYVNQ